MTPLHKLLARFAPGFEDITDRSTPDGGLWEAEINTAPLQNRYPELAQFYSTRCGEFTKHVADCLIDLRNLGIPGDGSNYRSSTVSGISQPHTNRITGITYVLAHDMFLVDGNPHEMMIGSSRLANMPTFILDPDVDLADAARMHTKLFLRNRLGDEETKLKEQLGEVSEQLKILGSW